MTYDGTRDRRIDLAAIREKLRGARGQEYWRSLEQLADSAEFRAYLESEFPSLAAGWSGLLPRREVLKLMGASLALAGLTACARAPREKVVPYVRSPEEFVPGRPLFYATAMPLAGYGTGVLAESHMGRPTKIEGNPLHPASLGAVGAMASASVLGLYDPDRSQAVVSNGRLAPWVSFLAMISAEREAQQARRGSGLRILTEALTSPTLAFQLDAVLRDFPGARWYVHEPAAGDTGRAGMRQAFGVEMNAVYAVDRADVLVCLDCDLLAEGPGHLRYARDWASRRASASERPMNRLYVAESTPTNTGAAADHRLCVRPVEIEALARGIASGIGIGEGTGTGGETARWVQAVVRDLKQHRARSLVVAGDTQPAAVHALVHAINSTLGNAGETIRYTDPAEVRPPADGTISELAEEMRAGKVDFLMILGGNPVYTAPANVPFARGLSKVRTKVHLSLYSDETSRLCNWHIPAAHYLESWGDVRAYDGTVSVIQPLIAPLYEGKSAHEMLSALLGKPGVSGHATVQEHWKDRVQAGNFEEYWQTTLHDGVMKDTALPAKAVSLAHGWDSAPRVATAAVSGLDLLFRPDPSVFDGRFANNGWLQELPRPLTKLTWDNAALLSPATAERLGLRSRDIVEIALNGRIVEAPVWITPGQAGGCVTLHLGYGRSHAGKVGTGNGANAYLLRTTDALWEGHGAEVRKTGRQAPLACTQDHHGLEGRNIYRAGTVAEFQTNPRFVREAGEDPPRDLTLYPEYAYTGHAWGMAVDLSACIGCNACVAACQAENNIPVVGREEVARGREMHWIRIDRYYRGDPENPSAHFQPVMCMHCENAPCEPVCPVNATNHSSEGLNQMVYNRCVGTRYCSNNCPYKVRRFNFYQYSDYTTPSLVGLRNPDVTVRGRGVMEKCTCCVQRINAAKIRAEKEGRDVRDGEIVTACQAACPTQAIVFGDINQRGSRVSQAKSSSLGYGMLAELNTRPRTSYLARLRNPNPEFEKE